MVEAFTKVSEASRLLLDKGLCAATGAEALGMVARPLKVDRACIFENRTTNLAGRFLTDLRHAWAEPGVVSPHAHPVLRSFAMRDYALAWMDMLEAGMVVSCAAREAPPLMRDVLERQGVQSVLLCPITPAKQWWGFVAFEDCRQARVWRPEEVSLLKSLARAIGASVRHANMRSSLSQVRTNLTSVLRTASGDT
ncbi:GAF domain-containing protein [Corallococcus sp. ZKHCc1 1396]|uniref:GAF domain-containing protein n=1 Tax=Corallococcus soli TaxID=2710757 RepID=A0ABR9PHV6_9BACT|nr:GAF domain-containing protein [Corallococcus soli]MBE4747510.1 GAF domain-containing protein [Corallococcus soli]